MGNRPREADGQLERHFAGEFAHSVDEKGRLAIPAKFRGRFKEGAVVTRWIRECLAIFPPSEWDAINAEVAKRPRTDRATQQFVHFVLGGAHETEPDAQGRIVIPAHLRQYASLGAEAVVIGAAQHLEVWEPGRWQRRLDQIQPGIADDLAGLGI